MKVGKTILKRAMGYTPMAGAPLTVPKPRRRKVEPDKPGISPLKWGECQNEPLRERD